MALRTNEYREVTVSGQAFSPTEAAKQIKAGTGVHDWIPGPVSPDSPLPLTRGEIAALYGTNGTLRKAEEDEMARGRTGGLPKNVHIWSKAQTADEFVADPLVDVGESFAHFENAD
jgi:hypothetical protein